METVINDLIIEVTRRCNIRCDHCMRGDPVSLDMNLDYVSRLFDKINRIYTLTLTGGEPSLVPHIISGIFDLASQKNVSISHFYMVTNAKDISNDFINALLDAYMYCEGEEEELFCLDISLDIQHQDAIGYIPEENIKKLMALRFTHKRNENHDYSSSLGTIWEGRAAQFYSYTGRLPQISKVYYEEEYGELMIESLYLNCLGNILPDCDLSYKSQDNPEIIICNVKRKFSLLNSIKRYNKRIKDGKIENIKVA